MSESMHRVFFALWPTAEALGHLEVLAGDLLEYAAGHPRRTPVDNLHLTLAFVGGVPASRLDALYACAARVSAQAFELSLDRFGFWPQGGILWAGCGPPAPLSAADEPSRQRRLLTQLANELRAQLQAHGFTPDPQPFTPHVTLARGVRRADLPRLGTPVRWRADEFVLLESQRGVKGSNYATLASFPLTVDER